MMTKLVVIPMVIHTSMFHVEQSGTYFESTLKERQMPKNSQERVDLHIRISKENYISLIENFRNRFSETINKLLDFLRTEQPFEILVFGKKWARGESNPRPPACEAGVITTRPRALVSLE